LDADGIGIQGSESTNPATQGAPKKHTQKHTHRRESRAVRNA